MSLVFAQEPVLDGEWTETIEMEINERRIGKYTGKVVEIGKIDESQMGLEWPGRRILVVAVSASQPPSGASNLVRVQGAFFVIRFLCRFSHMNHQGYSVEYYITGQGSTAKGRRWRWLGEG